MEKLTCEKTRAAYLLSDEIFGAFRGAQLANHLLNSAMDFRLDDEEIDDTDQYVLRATFKELIWRMRGESVLCSTTLKVCLGMLLRLCCGTYRAMH